MITTTLLIGHAFNEHDVVHAIDVATLGLTEIRKEYRTELGYIDIMAVDDGGHRIPIEVKFGEANDRAVGQILGYMKSVGAERGIIIAADFSKRVKAVCEDLNITLVMYTCNKEMPIPQWASESTIDARQPWMPSRYELVTDNTYAYISKFGYLDFCGEQSTKRTRVSLPKWMHTPIEILNTESGMSFAKLYAEIAHHGTSIMRQEFSTEMIALQRVRIDVLRSGDEWSTEILQNFKPLGNKTFVNPYQKTIDIPKWCIEYLDRFSTAFPIKYLASIRLAMCYSLIEWKDIPTDGKDKCQTEIDSFGKYIIKYIEMCNQLVA